MMVKGDDNVYTGEFSLPKGTKFDIKILKSTVSTFKSVINQTSTWSSFSKTFATDGIPLECSAKLTNNV